MKIDDAAKKTSIPSVGTTQTRAGKGADKAGASKPSADNVHLSTQVKALASHGENTSVFDSKKVQEIKAAIANGQFQVDPEKVANGLLDTVNDLIHARKA
ncbi:MAG TPA: flagellar biosynthesis anti-sigma factor FlgM [Burkholderiaceae bacterium]|nr:flagellar biosynthesis anti-sigma factor FlgM [Burkholderiaceae bacterium]